jgi:beta-glucosidase
MGLADMLLAGRDGRARFDFTGRLPFDWPSGDCLPKRGGVQFERGFGLTLASRSPPRKLPESRPVMACPPASR